MKRISLERGYKMVVFFYAIVVVMLFIDIYSVVKPLYKSNPWSIAKVANTERWL